MTVPAEGMRYLNHGDVLTFVGAGLYAVQIILVGDFTQEHSVSALSLIQVAGCAAMAWVMTGTTAAIHWQALRLWLKGVRFLNGPAGDDKAIDRHSASAESAPRRGPSGLNAAPVTRDPRRRNEAR